MVVQYKVYSRQELDYIDGGIVRDFNIDLDYISNNTSTVEITTESDAFKGDIIAVMYEKEVVLGVITAVDNTARKISFKHMKEIFNDKVINLFLYTSLLNTKFEAVAGLKTILTYAFITTDDPYKKLPMTIRTHGEEPNAVYTDDNKVLGIGDFITYVFDRFNIYLDFAIDFVNNQIVCTIAKNTTGGYVIKDNIKLSEPQFDSNELPAENKVSFFNANNGNIVGEYFLLSNNTVNTSRIRSDRVLPPSTKYVEWDAADAAEKGYTMQQLAESELCGNIYNHCILYKLAKRQTMIKCMDFKYGDSVTIVYKDREYASVFTGLKFKMKDAYYTCIFGKTRIDFTDRMKLYNDRRYAKRGGF